MRTIIKIFIFISVFLLKNTNIFAQSTKADSLTLIGWDCYQKGQYDKAIRYEEDALKIREQELGKEHPDYEATIKQLCYYYIKLSDKEKAYDLYTAYAQTLISIANSYYDKGNYQEAVRMSTKACEMMDSIKKKTSPIYTAALNSLALNKQELGEITETVSLLEKALQIEKKEQRQKTQNYVNMLNNLANAKVAMGNYIEAINQYVEVLRLELDMDMDSTISHATTLTNFAHVATRVEAYDAAIHACEDALKIWNKFDDKNDFRYAMLLSNLASCYNYIGNYHEAIEMGKEALQITENVLGANHVRSAKLKNNIASYHYGNGDYQEALRLGNEALQLMGDHKETSAYAEMLLGMVIYNSNLKDIPSLEMYVDSCYGTCHRLVMKNFRDCTEYERNWFWMQYQGLFESVIPRLSYLSLSEQLVKCGYNASLFNKGMLLDLSRSISELILNSNDKNLISLYEKLRSDRLQLQQLYEKPINRRFLNTDSLEETVNKQERELIQKSKVYGDYVKNMEIKWEDVQRTLETGDIAVEFVSFPLGSDSTIYIAYVLDKEMKFPEMVPLFEEKQLKGLKDIYIQKQASELVWEPLSKYFADKKNVYFAPDGELYNIAIESLPHWSEDCLMSDKWNMYRLSSTRELAVIKDKNALKQASVYGGVKYDTSTDMLVADHRKFHTNERSVEFLPFVLSDSLNLRSGVAYLPATRMEAEEIDKTLENKKIATSLRIDTLATEGDFKSLSGKGTDLLHVATHGFYWTEREAQYRDDLRFLMLSHDKNPRYVEDKALTRSGLLLAGANNALMGKQLPEGVDDGILTAKEISQLDLRGMDLVVLSACQTGLGEIKGDGVFGLQRGFKKAGVNSILMSLWKVDDEATRILMTQFYKNLTSEMSKFESLKQAQKSVREKNPKYQDPYYWAAFILLDAIH